MNTGGNWFKFGVLALFVFVSLFVLLSRFKKNPIPSPLKPAPVNVKPVSTSSGTEFQLGPVVLENVTRQYGLFDIQPTFGAAAYDADQDGWPDLLISNHGHPPVVFLNVLGRSFKRSKILDVPGSDRHAPVLADYDNDGDEDLLFMHGAHRGTGLGPKELYQNPGKGQPFVLVKNSGVEDPKGRGRGAIWFDYDNDGFVDLLEVNQFRTDAPNRLFHNNGDDTFTDVSAKSGLKISMASEGGAVAG
ncbi:MAG TPA: VCBS repeat-containing protein, partial [Acidobacteriota bacterium]|nr:VCBS repeat-containing protein [Acidobacteriota bacterium]